MATISPYAFAQQNAQLKNLLQSDEWGAREEAQMQALLGQIKTQYKAATGADVDPGAFLNASFQLPAGFTQSVSDGNDQETKRLSLTPQGTVAQGAVFTGPDGKLYMDNAQGTDNPGAQIQAGDMTLTPYEDANKWGAAQDSFLDNFMVNLPVSLAAAVPMAGVSGVLGGLQGLEGTSLIPGFDAAQYMGGTSPTDFSGATYGNAPGIVDPGSGFLNVGAEAGTTASGVTLDPALGASYGLPEASLTDQILGGIGSTGGAGAGVLTAGVGGSGAAGGILNNLPNIPTGGMPGGSGGAMDMTGSANSPIPGQGQAGTVFDQGIGGGQAAQTDLQRILSGQGTAADSLQIAGGAGSTLLGYLGAQNQTDAFKDVAAQNLALGAPYRDRLNASYAPGFDLANDPVYQGAFNRAADISARSWSSKAGNPAGSPTAQAGILNDVWQGSALPALSNYRGQLGQFGGMGLNTSGAAQMAGANASGGTYDALGFGLSQLTQPQNSLQDLLKQVGGGLNNYKLVY